MTQPNGNADQIAYWNERAASTWTEFQTRIDSVFTPLTALALRAAAPAAGERVIDIGCGCGATVLELARLVGPTGHVLGVDVSEPMAARAAQRVAEAGLTQARIEVSDASTRDMTGAGADLLFSRFGVMFFADPVAAFANLRQAMRPDGRLLFACWRPLADNSWFHVPLNAARDLLPPQPPADPIAPGPFAFADADRVKAILTQAGWRDADAARHDVPMHLGPLSEAIPFATKVGALARLLAEAAPDVRQAAEAAVAAEMRARDSADGVVLGGSVWLVSARA